MIIMFLTGQRLVIRMGPYVVLSVSPSRVINSCFIFINCFRIYTKTEKFTLSLDFQHGDKEQRKLNFVETKLI